MPVCRPLTWSGLSHRPCPATPAAGWCTCTTAPSCSRGRRWRTAAPRTCCIWCCLWQAGWCGCDPPSSGSEWARPLRGRQETQVRNWLLSNQIFRSCTAQSGKIKKLWRSGEVCATGRISKVYFYFVLPSFRVLMLQYLEKMNQVRKDLDNVAKCECHEKSVNVVVFL